MLDHKWMCRWFVILLLSIPFFSFASNSVKSMVIFGDSYSDTGNTTHLLKSLRQEENPAYIVAPFKNFVINKMIDFANDYYVPQIVLDAGLNVVTNFFDNDLAPYLVSLINRVKLVPILPGKPYWNSRFSNGKVWNEYLAELISIQKSDEDVYTNMAYGGAWASTYDHQLSVWNLIRHPIGTIKTLIVGKLIPPSLGLTVQGYVMQHHKLNSQTVYFVFSGSNDYLNFLLFEDNYNATIMSNYVNNVIDGISSAVLKLEKAGAKRFVIMGIPKLGETPRFVNTSDREVINLAVELHNTRLASRIEEWKILYPNADFLFIDTTQTFSKAFANPEQYGFSNLNEACIDVKFPMFKAFSNSPFAGNYALRFAQVLQHKEKSFVTGERNYSICDTPEDYLYWDEIHPSTRAHNYLALEICSAMKDHGYSISCDRPDTAI
jgi:phospholipase/lecithinase/hemolysin